MGKEFHVSIKGDDSNKGTREKPFKTISHAARIARAGDTITVHKGTYREWVDPEYGGKSDTERIIYQAAPDEEVIIKGSEVINSWERTDTGIWKTEISNSLFEDYNPYQVKIYGDWFNDKGRDHHTGEVYINGKSMFEVESLKKVINPVEWEDAKEPGWSRYTWYCESDDNKTTIWANFHEYNPENNLIEINVRPFCFWPKKTGINYITVRGFIMKQAATQWAPPTALQTGLIGPHWSKGWIIENNIISDSKCSGISLGKEKNTGHNEWTKLKCKHGTQRERDVIFKALYSAGWSKENIGSHIVRNNTIYNCEQTGICGHLGAVFSEITDNHIYNIHTKRFFEGFELAGIKLHAPIDVIIKNNHIHNTFRGMWMDWQTQGTRITGNLLYDNDVEDLYIEVSHGPYLVDNNLLLSKTSLKDWSQGGAFVHNLFAGKINAKPVHNRFTPYHYPHSTQVAGLMTILGGDNRFYNNIFAVRPEDEGANGLNVYDDCPTADEKWYAGCQSVDDYAVLKLPVYCGSNLYFNGAKPYKKEINPIIANNSDLELKMMEEDDDIYLYMNTGKDINDVKTEIVDSELLEKAFQSEARFENVDGTDICVNNDYFGQTRSEVNPLPGPFAEINIGQQKINLDPKG